MASHPLTARANEEHVTTITSADRSQSITIFRSSGEQFRIVLECTVPSRPQERLLVPQSVFTREDKLIPRYALPTMVESAPEMAVLSRNEETLYTFDSFDDMYRFQTALTGYDVSHDQQGIRCQFSDNVSFLDCSGRIQLWQEPIIISNDATLTSGDSSLHGSGSTSGGTASRYSSLTASMATSNTIHWTTGGWEAERIKLPSLTIYTELVDRKKRRFAIISVELDTGIYVDATECNCSRNYDTCSKLVLSRGRKADFAVRALYSDVDTAGQSEFDLFPFQKSRQSGPEKLHVRRTEYLVLKFSALHEKQRFHEELQLRFRVRDKQMENQRDFVNQVRQLEVQRPRHKAWSQALQQREPPLRTPSLQSNAPQLNVSISRSTLADSFTRSMHSRISGEVGPNDNSLAQNLTSENMLPIAELPDAREPASPASPAEMEGDYPEDKAAATSTTEDYRLLPRAALIQSDSAMPQSTMHPVQSGRNGLHDFDIPVPTFIGGEKMLRPAVRSMSPAMQEKKRSSRSRLEKKSFWKAFSS